MEFAEAPGEAEGERTAFRAWICMRACVGAESAWEKKC